LTSDEDRMPHDSTDTLMVSSYIFKKYGHVCPQGASCHDGLTVSFRVTWTGIFL